MKSPLFRVVISYRFNGLSLMTERAVRATSAGEALDVACSVARVDRCEQWKAFVEEARTIDCFSHECLSLHVVHGAGETVQEAYE